MKIFTFVIGFLALAVASVAAYFSVYGIATLFSGAFVATLVMASVLEVAKLGMTSYLYRYWINTHKALRSFMVGAVIGLMAITSWGIYGFLSSAYQTSKSGLETYERQLEIKNKAKSFKENEVALIEKRINSLAEVRTKQEERLSAGPPASDKRSTSELRLWNDQQIQLISETTEDMNKLQDELEVVAGELMTEELKISEFKGSFSDQKDILTFQFVADAMGVDLDTAVQWFILLFIIVFDPVAVALVLAYNTIIGIDNKKNKKVIDNEPKTDKVTNETPEPVEIKETIKKDSGETKESFY
jgi:hypothetical protein